MHPSHVAVAITLYAKASSLKMKVLVLNIWLGLGLGLEEKVLQFFKTFVVILDGIEQGMAFCERQQKQFAIRKPLFERTFCAPCTYISLS